MAKGRRKRIARISAVLPFLIEVGVYALLVTGYFFLVLHLLGGTLQTLYRAHRTAYGFLALALIVGQGVLLESITNVLLGFYRRWFGRP